MNNASLKEDTHMSKDFAWQLFKNTGNIDAFMIMRDIENSKDITPNMNVAGDNKNGNYQNKGNCDESSKLF